MIYGDTITSAWLLTPCVQAVTWVDTHSCHCLSHRHTIDHSVFPIGSKQHFPVCFSFGHHPDPLKVLHKKPSRCLPLGPRAPEPMLTTRRELSIRCRPVGASTRPVPMAGVVQPLSLPQGSQLQEGVGLAGASVPAHRGGSGQGQSTGPYLSPGPLGTPSLPTSSLFSGKFGAVCTCTEKATGLKLAAKVIKKQTPKDKVVGAGSVGRRGDPRSGYLSPPSTRMSAPGAWCLSLDVLKMALR